QAELWAPLVLDARTADKGASLRVFARLKADVSLLRARAEMSGLTATIEQANGSPASGATITPLLDVLVRDVKAALLVLLAASALVRGAAGPHVADLPLARAAGRPRALPVRTALGASRARVVSPPVSEVLVLAGAGAGAGLALTYRLVQKLMVFAPPTLARIV